MTKNDNGVSRSRALAAKVVFAALNAIKDNNRELPQRQVFLAVEQKVHLDEWAGARYEKTGNVRWQTVLHFYSIDCVKAGYLIKKSGIWYLTPEGEEAVKLGEMGLFTAANAAYKQWKLKNQSLADVTESDETDVEVPTQDEGLTVERAEAMALEGIKQFINAKNPYEFQDLAAALLRGMSYYTPFIAPRGKDGGVDIIAYRDPLGTVSPRIKIQIKHRGIAATVQEIRQLMGILQKDGDVGIFISTGGFTPDAKATARSSHVHVELIDLERFISLWQEFYNKLSDEDKSLLPLLPIYFVVPGAIA